MKPVHRPALPLVLLLVAACGSKDGGSSKTAGIELFGKRPIPPGDLIKVKPGMTHGEVKALFPSAIKTPNQSGSPSLSIDSGYSNAKYRIGFYSDKDAVASVEVRVPPDLGKKLETVWGPPAKTGGMGPTWIDEEAGYEVVVMEMGRQMDIDYRPFVPLAAAYFGTAPAPVDILKKVKLGMTRDEIAKAAPGFEKAGAPKGNGSYVPFDGEPKGVTISIKYDQNDKAEQFVVELPERGPDLVTKAWGARPGKSRGLGSPMNCWGGADGTKIDLDDNRLTYSIPDRSVCEVQ